MAALEIIQQDDVCERASRQAATLRDGINNVFSEEGIPWAAYGTFSSVYFYTNPEHDPLDPLAFDPLAQTFHRMRSGGNHPAKARFRLAMMSHGVDFSGKPGGLVSNAHSDTDIAQTVDAIRASVRDLKNEGGFAK